MNTEIKEALGALKEGLEAKTEEKLTALQEKLMEKFETPITEEEVKSMTTTLEELKSHNEALQKHLDEMDIALQSKKDQDLKDMHPVALYYKSFQDSIKDKEEEIKDVSAGQKLKFEVKATMTIGNNLTGDPIKTYNESPVELPFQRVNFADLVPNISSRTGQYTYYVEGAVTGGPIAEVNEGGTKPELEFNLTEVVCVAKYIAGFIRISKTMLQDLPFMMSFIPRALRREYWKAENAAFYTKFAAAASGTTGGTGGVVGIIEDIGVLEAKDYDVTGIVLNPADWATLAASQIPGATQSAVVSFVGNQMIIAGVPVFKASWVPAGKYAMGDWFWTKKIVVDGLMVEFFEQDIDNVIKNLITVRVESRVCLAVERPAAFIIGDVAATT